MLADRHEQTYVELKWSWRELSCRFQYLMLAESTLADSTLADFTLNSNAVNASSVTASRVTA